LPFCASTFDIFGNLSWSISTVNCEGGTVVQHLGQRFRKKVARGHEICHPNHAVFIHLVELVGGEMHRDKRRVGPIEQTGRKAVSCARDSHSHAD
jgi:hypothetical protein